jgi:hypothetical protein
LKNDEDKKHRYLVNTGDIPDASIRVDSAGHIMEKPAIIYARGHINRCGFFVKEPLA